MQEIEQYADSSYQIKQNFELSIKPDDILYITISTKDEELLAPFSNSQLLGSTGASTSLQETTGIQVNKAGYIQIPLIGEVKAEGLTRIKLEKLLKDELINKELIKDPVVQVRIKGLKIAVIGEVGNPGIKEFSAERVTLLEVLSAAGDLTPSGKRENITVLREENGVRKPYIVNLTSAKDILSSPVYYMQQNDLVYIEPNKSIRVKGSSTLSYISAGGGIISVLASIVSLIVVLSK